MSWTTRIYSAAVVRAVLCGFVLLGLAGPPVQHAAAALFTLNDANSLVSFDTSDILNAYEWNVDGQNQLFQQAFWYRIGNVAETSLQSLPHPVEGTSDGNLDGNQDTLFVRYNGSGFDVEVKYSLQGGTAGSRTSDLGEQIKITNTGAVPLDFHFFQYVDFDLRSTPEGDSAVFVNPNAVRQFEGPFEVAESVVTPAANHREIAPFLVTLNKLLDIFPSTLSDTPPIGTVVGPDDLTWAFQWDFPLPVGGSFLISKDKHLSGVPEPSALALLSIGAGLLFSPRRKR